jgi:hypothetical protein
MPADGVAEILSWLSAAIRIAVAERRTLSDGDPLA